MFNAIKSNYQTYCVFTAKIVNKLKVISAMSGGAYVQKFSNTHEPWTTSDDSSAKKGMYDKIQTYLVLD